MGQAVREIWLTGMGFWRVLADQRAMLHAKDDSADTPWHGLNVAQVVSNHLAQKYQYTYPSPRRFEPIGFGPTSLCAKRLTIVCEMRDHGQKSIVIKRQTAESPAHKTKQKKGSSSCNLSVSFSPSRPSRRFRPVSTMILSGASLGQPQVQSSQTPPVSTHLPVPSQAGPQEPCATKFSPLVVNAVARLSAALGRRAESLNKTVQKPEPLARSGVSFVHSRKGHPSWLTSSNLRQRSHLSAFWLRVTTMLNAHWAERPRGRSSAKPQTMTLAHLPQLAPWRAYSATTLAFVTNTTRFGASDTYSKRRAGDTPRGGFAF